MHLVIQHASTFTFLPKLDTEYERVIIAWLSRHGKSEWQGQQDVHAASVGG